MLEHLRVLLEAVVRTPETSIGALEILTKAERELLLVDWNQTAAKFPVKCIPELFEEQVERTPAEIAVVSETGQLTYAELNSRANQLARYLKKRGVGPEVLVGICVERSLEMVVGLLGIMKAGGAYVPLDPAYPAERLRFMLEDSGARLLLTQQPISKLIPEASAQAILLDSDWPEVSKENEENLPTKPATENLAYVIYTSGSTGKPKGVQISHSALVNFLTGMGEQLRLSAKDVLLSVTTLSFDIAGLEIYLPLTFGARVVIASKEVTVDGRELLQLLNNSGATVMQATPATWQLLIEAGWKGKAGLTILCGGEALSRDLADQLLARSNVLWNLYGPTETTIWSAAHQISSRSGGITIGRPIANTQIYILDPQLLPVPVGVPGELYIGGAGLARGYLKRPELTAKAFVPDPFSADGRARLYKTGDLARYLEDGKIEFLGRVDNQVKLRGFRIELGEIEAVIRKDPQVADAVVLAREDEPGDRRLVAYVVPNREASESNLKQGFEAEQVSEGQAVSNDPLPGTTAQRLQAALKGALNQQLPEYMRPSEFMFLEAFPLTPNGKVARAALPPPGQSRAKLEGTYVAPRTDVEKQLASIWAAVLRLETVGVNDNFFELGGHSLLATQFLSRIREHLKVELPLRKMFELPTVAGLAKAVVELQQKTKPAPVPVIRRRGRAAGKNRTTFSRGG